MRRKTTHAAATAVLLTMLTACGPGGGPADGPRGAPAMPSAASSKDFGEYVVHFSAVQTDDLAPEVAQRHGIVRSENRAMLNVSMLQKQVEGPPEPVAGRVDVSATNLTGQLKNVNVREVVDGQAVYYIAEIPVSDGETLIFDISARPEGATSDFEVRFKQAFYVD
jgi:hypothetical protein